MNSSICIDANIVIRSLVPATLSETAASALTHWQTKRKTLIAPSHLYFEVTSTLRRLVYLKQLETHEGAEAFSKFMQLKISVSSDRRILLLAWKLTQDFNRPRAYDTAYLALARLRRVPFWTADKRLYNAVKKKLSWVHWLGDFK